MKQISGSNNWKLVIRRGEQAITILRAMTCDRSAALPDELFGLPVTVLGDHALTPDRRAPEGEELLITCGVVPDRPWDNRELEKLTLPQPLQRVEDYGLYNCTKLKTLCMSDGVEYWGGGALMNCRVLDTFQIACTGREATLLAYLADELMTELDVTLFRRDGQTARLIFPEYAEVYEENVPHHQFDFRIYGAGYPYHHCFYQRKFSFWDYDELWKGYLSMGYDPDCAMRLAWWRLRYPVELNEAAEKRYWDYLGTCSERTARWLLEQRDAAGLRVLLAHTNWSKDGLAELCTLARIEQTAELLAILLEEQHRRFPAGADKTFDL